MTVLTRVSLLLATALYTACSEPPRLQIDANGGAITRDQDGTRLPAIEERMKHFGVPGMGIAVIRNGEIAWARGYGVLQAGRDAPVNPDTMFSVGSVSKVGAAVVILRLADQGRIGIDQDVNELLVSWQVPENEYTEAADVTLRGILSHTAGLTVHGFADFQPDEDLPSTVEILRGIDPAKNQPVVVDIPIGSQYRYSGGGTTVAQLVVEDTTGMPFHEAARGLMLDPLGMLRSTYDNPLPVAFTNVAKAHDGRGRPRALPRGYESMPEVAAAGLWTTPRDFAKLVIALMKAYNSADGVFLSQSAARDMMTEVHPSPHGIGPRISGDGASRTFGHGGSNESYKARFRAHLSSQSGVVVFTNGARGSRLIDEVFDALAGVEEWID